MLPWPTLPTREVRGRKGHWWHLLHLSSNSWICPCCFTVISDCRLKTVIFLEGLNFSFKFSQNSVDTFICGRKVMVKIYVRGRQPSLVMGWNEPTHVRGRQVGAKTLLLLLLVSAGVWGKCPCLKPHICGLDPKVPLAICCYPLC